MLNHSIVHCRCTPSIRNNRKANPCTGSTTGSSFCPKGQILSRSNRRWAKTASSPSRLPCQLLKGLTILCPFLTNEHQKTATKQSSKVWESGDYIRIFDERLTQCGLTNLLRLVVWSEDNFLFETNYCSRASNFLWTQIHNSSGNFSDILTEEFHLFTP